MKIKSLQILLSETLNQIKSLNSISVHIRRGDYVTNLKTSAVHGNLELDYYKKAIHLIRKQLKNSFFFFFSDDIELTKNNFNDENFYFVENNYNDLVLPFKDLLLMKNCKHNIIANSTFSWWGAWLNENPNKMIFAYMIVIPYYFKILTFLINFINFIFILHLK